MRSKDVTLRIPHRLWETFEKHSKEVGYENARQFLLWTGFYSLLVNRPHALTAPFAALPLEMQDELIDSVCASYDRGETKKGSFFEAFMRDVARNLGTTATPEEIRAAVAAAARKAEPPA